jgi:ribulose-phosphate 3-epimerase
MKILPSILSADFGDFAVDVQSLLAECLSAKAGGDMIHVDVMDGHLVPNISFVPPVIAKLRDALPAVYFDTHLMIDEPIRYAEAHVKAGSNSLTFHVEAPEVKGDLVGAVNAIRALDVDVGITLKPGTPVEAILPVIELVDLVLVMSVEPGFGGQSFMPDQLAKCRQIKPLLKGHQKLEIDGGINAETIGLARAAGVDWFVIGSALFDAPSRADVLRSMCEATARCD